MHDESLRTDWPMNEATASPLWVAVVDDEPSVRKALSRVLRSAGFAVRSFGSGAGFLESLRDLEPCCLVLDLHIPPPSGFDVLEILQNSGKSIATVVISAEYNNHNRTRVLAYGARAYLAKPVEDAQLLEVVSAAAQDQARRR